MKSILALSRISRKAKRGLAPTGDTGTSSASHLGAMEQHPSKHGCRCGDRRYSLSPGVTPGFPTSAEQTLAALLSVREVLASMEVVGRIRVCRFTLTPKARSPHGWAPYP